MEYKKKISVIIPMYFEEEVANECYTRLKNVLISKDGYDYEIVFVDDGSQDKTLAILADIAKGDKKVKVISFSRNFGHQVAVTAGLKYVTGDAILIIDADMQDPPEVLWEMVKLWELGNDVVYAKRKRRKGETLFKRSTAKMFYKTLNHFSDIKIPRDTGDFRLVDRKVVNVINSMPEKNKFLRGLFTWVGYRQVQYDYERQERAAGKTKYSISKMFKLAEDGIIGFSTKALKTPGYLAALSIIISIMTFIMSYIMFLKVGMNLSILMLFITGIVSFFSSLVLFSIYIALLYVGRIYDDVKERPEYIINKIINE